MNKTILLYIATTALLTGCSNDEIIDIKQTTNYEITFNSFVNKSTRATDLNIKNLGSFAKGFSVFGYTKSADGTSYQTIFADESVRRAGESDTWSYDNVQYWVDGNTYNFHAIAPYGDGSTDLAKNRQWSFSVDQDDKAKGTIQFTNIAKDNDDYTAAGEQDLIYSYQTANGSNRDEVSFSFSHLLSRVKFSFIGGTNNPASVTVDIKDITIKDAYADGNITIDNSSSTDLSNHNWVLGSTEALSFGSIDNIPAGSAKDSDHKYLIPNNNSTKYNATIVFELTAKVSGSDTESITYQITKDVELPEVLMKKGCSYVYEIGVNTSGNPDENNIIDPLVFNVTEVTEWDGDYIINPIGDITDKSQVELYDYAMSDGSFVSHNNELSSDQKAACVGIVFWLEPTSDSGSTATRSTTDNATLTYDKALMADYPKCTHGLIVSLKNLTYNGSTTMSWQGVESEDPDASDNESVYSVFQSTSDEYKGYTPVATKIGNKDGYIFSSADDAPCNYILGYSNTKIIKAYNINGTYTVKPVAALASKSNVYGFSSWYIPSLKELALLSDVNGANKSLNKLGEINTSNLIEINTYLSKLYESQRDLFFETYVSSKNLYYSSLWSSSEIEQDENETSDRAFYGHFYSNNFGTAAFGTKNAPLSARAVCAF